MPHFAAEEDARPLFGGPGRTWPPPASAASACRDGGWRPAGGPRGGEDDWQLPLEESLWHDSGPEPEVEELM